MARFIAQPRQVAVRMPFIDGNPVNVDETMSDEDCTDLHDALAFLAEHGLVYTDFRTQNVIRCDQDGRIRLIDYDDIRMVGLRALKEEYDVVLAKVSSEPGFGEWVRRAIFAALGSVQLRLTNV